MKTTIENNMYMIKAIKKADRELQFEQTVGFKCITRIHKSKKSYNRKKYNNIENYV